MIGSKNKEEANSTGQHNAMASGTIVKGNISTESDFRLDGQLEGNVSCRGKLVIGPQGAVTGKVTATNAEILGKIEGELCVEGKLILKSTASVKGDISTQSLEIEPNALFDGSCTMNNGEASS